jgi:hypothetical protein
MELPASKLRVALQPLFQNVVDVRFNQAAAYVEFPVEKREDYDPTFCHGVSFVVAVLSRRLLIGPSLSGSACPFQGLRVLGAIGGGEAFS